MPQVPEEGRGKTLREATDSGPNDLQNMQHQSLHITSFMATAWPAHSNDEEEQEHLDLEALAELVLNMYPPALPDLKLFINHFVKFSSQWPRRWRFMSSAEVKPVKALLQATAV